MKKRKLNIYGVPIWNDRERLLLHAAMIKSACKTCKAKAGYNCKGIPQDSVHVGRLPDGFKSVKAVEDSIAKLK